MTGTNGAGRVPSEPERVPDERRSKPERKRRMGFGKLAQGDSKSREARQLAAVILEVLGGVRTPTEAAAAVGVSPPRYYALEMRAIEGLLLACERRPRGPRRTAERECARLRREIERVTRECARGQALLRAQERVVGILPKPTAKEEGKGKRKKRRAVARALRAAAVLSAAGGSNPLETRGGKEDDANARKG
jgi:hypothetical protein